MIKLSQLAFPLVEPLSYLTIGLLIAGLILSLTFSRRRLASHSAFRRRGVVILNFLAFFSLLGLVLQPQIKTERGSEVRLITSGANQPSGQLPDNTYWLTESDSEAGGGVLPQNRLRYAEQILLRHPTLESLTVSGDGLSWQAWQSFEGVQIDYDLPPRRTGFTDIHWRQQLNLGEHSTIRGRWHPAKPFDQKAVFQIQLLDPAGSLVEQVEVLPDQVFQLAARPKVAGQHLYQLRVRDRQDQLVFQQKVALSVTSRAMAKLMVYQSAPSFETRQLQNWAAENGAKLLTSTQISRDKFIHRQTNFDELVQLDFSPTLLQQMDLLLIDGRGLINLPTVQRDILHEAVEGGLGLLVLADNSLLTDSESTDNGSWPELLASLELRSTQRTRPENILWSNDDNQFVAYTDEFLPILNAGFERIADINHQTLVLSAQQEPLLIRRYVGAGKVGLSLVRETFRWVTNGEQSTYSHFWQSQISALSRARKTQAISSPVAQALKFVGDRVELCVAADKGLSIDIVSNGQPQKLLLSQNISGGEKACGVFWPRVSGWHSARLTQVNYARIEHWFYVYSPDDWPAYRQQSKIDATLLKMRSSSSSISPQAVIYRDINRLWFALSFIGFALLLWLERKLLT